MKMKLCRICWNTAGWRRPTGEAAELETGDSYVAEHGYGHEEWLFNYEWMIDGYRYGFVQPIGKFHSKYAGETTSLCLYTVTPDKDRLIVGVIREAYIPTLAETKNVFREFKWRGWIKQMEKDCEVLGVEPFNAGGLNEGGVINIRFKPEDVELFDPMLVADPGHTISRNSRYQPFNWDGTLPSISETEGIAPNSQKKRSEQSRKRAVQEGGEYDPTHVRLQNRVYDLLVDQFGVGRVFYERGHVDLSIETDKGTTLIEIKTAPTAKRCMREAIGQLLEYAHYSKTKKSCELVIMGDAPMTQKDESYLEFLRAQYDLPLHYSQYVWQDGSMKGWGEHLTTAST
ncbi:hypothetical protein CKO15_11165 [Halorhodospira abdelmalekii]|uniref:hypothetical protein n=1 Tax=Halorhodospira abdelmalekii TaxID=421629 RepID=UPI0019084A5C|nr:hypothetical protein [Halorhodospira abdelmalekii]MBK1735826.1 hypothetical protein [Halorhodospira abdelmalekii]